MSDLHDAETGATHPLALTILVKGSRGSAMDKIVTALLQRDAGSGKETTNAA